MTIRELKKKLNSIPANNAINRARRAAIVSLINQQSGKAKK